jgi:UDP-3-O-acyl-N-acetylglucosamine deacetylase
MAIADLCATVRETVRFEGVGLHTGELCRIAIHPVSEVRTRPAPSPSARGQASFPARWDYVVDTTRATVLGDGATRVSTVEHLMAALWITGITHCDIEVLQGNEIPILDGSALPFVQALQAVKIANPPSPQPSPPLQRGERETESPLNPSSSPHFVKGERETESPLNPSSSPHFVKGERETESPLNPSSSLLAWAEGVGAHGGAPSFPLSRYTGEGDTRGEGILLHARHADRYLGLSFGGGVLFGYIDFPAPLGVQAGAFPLADAAAQIAPARTFGFLREVEALRQQGLALGGALDNALLIDETGYHNPARFEDEPLRHKLLDVLGDLYLCGARLTGFTLVAIKPGHALNVQLARQVAQAILAED